MATKTKCCERKLTPVIANNLKHKKTHNAHWQFLSMSYKALAFFAEVKCKALKTQRQIRHKLPYLYVSPESIASIEHAKNKFS